MALSAPDHSPRDKNFLHCLARHEFRVHFPRSFAKALEKRDDFSALSLLENGRVTIHSRIRKTPVLFVAVEYEREAVVRELVRLGADIDAPRAILHIGEDYTPAGEAILVGNVPGLKLCHDLGASMSLVNWPSAVPMGVSAVDAAIRAQQPACLAYLLDIVYSARPVHLDLLEMTSLSCLAIKGGRAKALCDVLVARGFDFKLLEVAEFPDDEAQLHHITPADVMLMGVQKSGDARFMRYLVKDLGMASTTGRIGVAKPIMCGELPVRGPEVVLVEYESAACDAVCATRFSCTGCRVAQYCSKECFKRHWKTGGHKTECKEMQRAAALAVSGSSVPAEV